MRSYLSLLSIAAIYATLVRGSPTPPQSYFLASAKIGLGQSARIKNPLGTRVSVPFESGTFVDGNGNTLATLVAGTGGENGLVDPSGTFHIDARMTIAFSDGAYGYLQYAGAAIFGQSGTFRLTVDTNSTKYDYLNHVFIWGTNVVVEESLLLDFFSTTKPT